jgi:type VI secretion system protein ImpK
MVVPVLNLVHLMNAFYQQIAAIKKWIVQDRLALEAKERLRLQELPTDQEMAQSVNLMLSQWLSKKRLYWQDGKLTDKQLELLDKACFAMCSLADELFILQIDWQGNEQWHEVLLEEHFFQSSSAGGTFYRDVDQLLSIGSYDLQERELAAVYLMALRLGFAGKYRDLNTALSQYRNKLFNVVAQNQSSTTDHIHPQAYEHCLISQHEQRLAPVSKWHKVLLYGFGIYLTVGIIAWLVINHGVDRWVSS